ncbi:MAG: hypothetical protein ACRDKT_18295 [Actinomycetota bacterium]
MRRLAMAVTLAVLAGCADVSFVDRITVANDTDFPATVDVTDAARSGWLRLGLAQDVSETSFGNVIDQGDVWVFRFDYAGKFQQELEVTRADLERNDWTIMIPPEFETALREMGLDPPP